MEEIKKNLLALWKGLSPQRRVSLIGSFLLSLAVLSAVVYFASKPRLTLLYGGLAPAEAGKVTEYLDSKKITYDVTDGGRAVLVPAQDVYSARMGLASQGIPTMSDSGVGFELFDKPTFGESDFMQRANYYRALQGELARTIKQLDEVSNARVLIVVPEDKLFGQDHQEAKASVFVQLQPGRTLSSNQVQAIRFLVANGVEGLQPEHVAVIDSTGRAIGDSDDSSAAAAAGQITDKQRQARADLEHYLEEKAQSMLDQVLGPGPGRGARRLRDRLHAAPGNLRAVRPEELRHRDRDEHDRIEHDAVAKQLQRGGRDRQLRPLRPTRARATRRRRKTRPTPTTSARRSITRSSAPARSSA